MPQEPSAPHTATVQQASLPTFQSGDFKNICGDGKAYMVKTYRMQSWS